MANDSEPVRVKRTEPFVLREFPMVGKYRVRLLKSSAGPRGTTVVDIREYAKGESFEGFTRRGIRLTSMEEARILLKALQAIEEDKLLKDDKKRGEIVEVLRPGYHGHKGIGDDKLYRADTCPHCKR